jgi:exopolysaccharide biosynthesis polyprenyl glycosylphosphotransferase
LRRARMLKEQTKLVAASAYALDLAATAAAFSAAHLVRSSILPHLLPASFPSGLFPFDQYAALLPWVLLIWTGSLLSTRSYRSQRTTGLPQQIVASAKVAFGSTLMLAAVVFVLRFDFVSRPFLALFAVLDFLLLAGVRVAIRLVARSVRAKGYNYRTVLVVGTGARAVALTESILAHAHWGLRLAGFVTDHEHPAEIPAGVRIVGSLDDLPRLLTDHGAPIDEVVFVVSRRRLAELDAAFRLCEELGIRTRVALDFLPLSLARIELEEFDGVPLLSFSTTPTDAFALAGKRFADIALSGLLLVAIAPLLGLIALVLRLTSRGPVLFRQLRCGLNGRKFTLLKFRTMVDGAHDLLDDVRHLNEMSGPVFKSSSDPRVTPVGRFLRRWSLDELPQLWNVFRGDMSLVGPRPPIPEEVDRYERWQRRRLSMKPGLTCLWQVSGRNDLDFEDWMNLDLEYIDNWTPMLDVKILARTIPAVLLGRGAR